eukprot:8806581-Pyramimonas_sp.AAC.2
MQANLRARSVSGFSVNVSPEKGDDTFTQPPLTRVPSLCLDNVFKEEGGGAEQATNTYLVLRPNPLQSHQLAIDIKLRDEQYDTRIVRLKANIAYVSYCS